MPSTGKGDAEASPMSGSTQTSGSVLFFPDSRDEIAFLRYVGQTNNKVARWQRLVSCGCSGMACMKILMLAVSGGGVRNRCLLAAAFMLSAAGSQVWALAAPLRPGVRYYSYHEHYKVAVEVVNLTALLVTIIMLKSGELAFNTPLSAMVLRGFCMTIDQLRLHTSMRLYVLQLLVFELMVWSRWAMGEFGQSPWKSPLLQTLLYVLLGVFVPLGLGVTMEAQLRQGFLQQHDRSLDNLGPFWQGYLESGDRLDRSGRLLMQRLKPVQVVLAVAKGVGRHLRFLETVLHIRHMRYYIIFALVIANLAWFTRPAAGPQLWSATGQSAAGVEL